MLARPILPGDARKRFDIISRVVWSGESEGLCILRLLLCWLGLINIHTKSQTYLYNYFISSSTYDHRVWRTGLPVRSAVLKPHAGRLVVWWVTTCESRLLYVFLFVFLFVDLCILKTMVDHPIPM